VSPNLLMLAAITECSCSYAFIARPYGAAPFSKPLGIHAAARFTWPAGGWR
jgi:hypothetical protein